jgi:hypothetical protein
MSKQTNRANNRNEERTFDIALDALEEALALRAPLPFARLIGVAAPSTGLDPRRSEASALASTVCSARRRKSSSRSAARAAEHAASAALASVAALRRRRYRQRC